LATSNFRCCQQGEYQWAKFELAREKAPAARKQKDEPKKTKKKAAVVEEAKAEDVAERVAPPDLEEEMQGMFGAG